MVLYDGKNKVIKVTDSDFKNSILQGRKFKGEGVIQAYADWCGFCQRKEACVKKLAEELREFDFYIYVIDDENIKFLKENGVEGFPTFLRVDVDGRVAPLRYRGKPVHSVPDIVNSLCDYSKQICGIKLNCDN